ncbi:hypothetical protein AX17_002944 [Amanita inopinata Kibby_2008]|nr:hypothetical protein AX17_002944 [Amanita inopinata Kibby_2008]
MAPRRVGCTSADFGLAPKGIPFDSNHKFITSPVFSTPVLAGVRLAVGAYTFITLLTTLIWDSTRSRGGDSFFSYFTHLSYIGLCAYFWAAGVQTWVFGRKRIYMLQWWPRVLQFLHVLLYATITTFPILVTVVFWTLLTDPKTFSTSYSTWSNVSVHILNTVFALSELILTNVPPAPWLFLPQCVVLLGCYLGVAYITYDTQGFYTYSFLDPKKEGVVLVGYILGIAAGECVLYAIVYGLVLLRTKLVDRYSHPNPEESSQEEKEALDEWEEVSRPSEPEA